MKERVAHIRAERLVQHAREDPRARLSARGVSALTSFREGAAWLGGSGGSARATIWCGAFGWFTSLPRLPMSGA
jgi:hypothetical protein